MKNILMNDDIRKKIIKKITALIPPHIKAVDYLSDILEISKESAYRRMRGEMSFAFDEIIKLSKELGFSIDELTGLDQGHRVAVDFTVETNPKQAFFIKLSKYKEDIDARLRDRESHSMMALNYLPSAFTVHFRHLFKFAYYTWLQRKRKAGAKLYYSDITISPELESLRKQLDIDGRNIRHNTFILDHNVFLSPIKEIHYFYKMRFVTSNELIELKEDFHNMLDFVEKMVRTGESNPGTEYFFYLSDFNIDSNSSYNVWSDKVTSSFNFNFFNRIVISNPEICEIHKEWLDSLKKYSTLITQSNEIVQAAYFEKQRRYVDNIETGRF